MDYTTHIFFCFLNAIISIIIMMALLILVKRNGVRPWLFFFGAGSIHLDILVCPDSLAWQTRIVPLARNIHQKEE